MGGSGSGRYGSGRPKAEWLRRFDLAECLRLKGNDWPDGAVALDIKIGKVSARAQLPRTATCCCGRGLWICCPRCDRRSRVLYIGFGRIACRHCFRLRYHSQSLDRQDRCLHAMQKIAKRIDPETDGPDLPEKPPGMHRHVYERLA